MIEAMAMHWFYAEYGGRDWHTADEADRQIARERVRELLAGEVRRSECGHGDILIWEGRRRAGETLHPEVAQRYANNERRWFGHYDCFELPTEPAPTLRLFGNAQVGDVAKTDIRSDLVWDVTAFQSWHVTCPVYDDGVTLERALYSVQAVLEVGHKERARAFLADLFRMPQPLCALAVQRMPVRVCLDRVREVPRLEARRVYVHLEGWEIRTEA